jgi:hypothetical protein
MCFRSEKETAPKEELDPQRRELIGNVYRLLHNWKTPPGTTADGKFDFKILRGWVEKASELCMQSGHWPIAQQTIGHTLAFAPAGIEGLLANHEAAKVLDDRIHDEMRTGFRLALFNERGVHGFTHGAEELKLADTYRDYAARYDLAKFARIAATLRTLAEGYERDAARDASRSV